MKSKKQVASKIIQEEVAAIQAELTPISDLEELLAEAAEFETDWDKECPTSLTKDAPKYLEV